MSSISVLRRGRASGTGDKGAACGGPPTSDSVEAFRDGDDDSRFRNEGLDKDGGLGEEVGRLNEEGGGEKTFGIDGTGG